MSTKEDLKTKEAEEPKIDEETGLPEGLDPGYSYTDKSPEEKSEPIPTTHGSRLVGKTAEEAAVILAEEHVAAAEAAVEAEKDAPSTPEEELSAAQKELAEAEKAAAAAEKTEETPSTTKPAATTSRS